MSEARRKKRRDEIVQATLRCFARQGLAKTSMADIIREAGLSAGSVYSHFENKAELLRTVVSEVLRSRLTALVEDIKADRGEVAPRDLLTRLLVAAPPDATQARTALQAWAEVSGDAEISIIATDNLHHIRDTLANAMSANRASRSRTSHGTAVATADGVLAAVFGYVVRIALDPATSPAAVRRGILKVFASQTNTSTKGQR